MPSPGDSQATPLLIHNLLNNFEELGRLLLHEVEQNSWLNAYLLAAGMNQIVEDYLHPDAYRLSKVAKYLGRYRAPVGPLAAGTSRQIGAAIVRGRSRLPQQRNLLCWQAGLADLVLRLAEVVSHPVPDAAPERAELPDLTRSLLAAMENFPASLRREVLRLPSCFRSFDQQPADLEYLVSEFARRWPERARPLMVVGVRTSGNYLAPLCATFLKAQGFQDVSVLTLRPARVLLRPERAALWRLVRHRGLVLVVDDPPTTGNTLIEAIKDLEHAGVVAQSVVLLLQLFTPADAMPTPLQHYAFVLLPWDKWAIHNRLTLPIVQSDLAELLGPDLAIRVVERLPLPARNWIRSHVRALYRVQVTSRSSGRQREQLILVKGAGLGYFGEHALAVAGSLPGFVPRIYGYKHGLLYRAWLPDEGQLSLVGPAKRRSLAGAVAEYVLTRSRVLAVEEDVSWQLAGQNAAWEVTSNLLSRAFGRGWLLARMPIVDPLVKRLLMVERPSVIDGNMDLSRWFVDEAEPHRLRKVDFDERAFCNLDLYCYDPIFDLAGAVTTCRDAQMAAELCRAYETLSGEPVDEERWLLYQLVHLWDQQRSQPAQANDVGRAMSRVVQLYFSTLFFSDLALSDSGDICALDIDGVLETEPLGFPSLTPTSAIALRALVLHGYRPVLGTGRSLDEMRDRCNAYHLAGGIAEYGAVVYNRYADSVQELLSQAQQADLDRLRWALDKIHGVYLDKGFRYAVRAYRLDRAGRRRGLTPEMIEIALATSRVGVRLRPIKGRAQTDFMVAGIDKGIALRALVEDLGFGPHATLQKPLALAVGDTVSDLPMLRLASLAVAPAHADSSLRRAGVKLVRRRYQPGLALAVSQLIGHPPGSCPICRSPGLPPRAQWLLTLLATQERGGWWGIVWQALLLAVRLRRPNQKF